MLNCFFSVSFFLNSQMINFIGQCSSIECSDWPVDVADLNLSSLINLKFLISSSFICTYF